MFDIVRLARAALRDAGGATTRVKVSCGSRNNRQITSNGVVSSALAAVDDPRSGSVSVATAPTVAAAASSRRTEKSGIQITAPASSKNFAGTKSLRTRLLLRANYRDGCDILRLTHDYMNCLRRYKSVSNCRIGEHGDLIFASRQTFDFDSVPRLTKSFAVDGGDVRTRAAERRRADENRRAAR